MAPKEKTTIRLEEVAAGTGEYLRFALLFLGSFEANLATAGPEDATRERIALAANCDAGAAQAVRIVTDAAFHLNAGFRENTTPMYFDLLGYRSEYSSLTQTGWLNPPDNRRFIRNLIAQFFDAAIGSSAASAETLRR